VAIASGDYYTNDQKQAHPIDYRRTNDVLLEYTRAGGLVTLSVHTNNPVTGGPAWDSRCDLREVITPGTPANRDWMSQLSQIADGLDELRQAGVVVLFRPFHEMTGGWFWWGGKDAELFMTLWRDTFNYLSRDRGLDHLLWVYTPAAGVGDMLNYYPSGEYVDLVGFDVYTPAPATLRERYEQLLTTGKPFGFGEYGPVGGGAAAGDATTYDWATFARSLREDFPRACYFVTWRDHWGLDHYHNPGGLLNDPRILNRDRLSSDRA
jgi:mannan endo-1,4-beta-mannosidase